MNIASIDYRGFRYFYKTSGDITEPCVLILGGALQSLNAWDNYVQRFAGLFNVIVCDLPGMGESDTLPHSYPIEFLGDCVKHLLDALAVGHVHIFAASYGTPIAYVFARDHPERTARVGLAGTMDHIPVDVLEDTRKSVEYLDMGDLDQAATLFCRMFVCTDRIDDIDNGRLAQRLLHRGVKKMSATRIASYIQNTERLLHTQLHVGPVTGVPFLIFTGEYDNYTRPELCRHVARKLECSEYTVIRRADHLANIERSDVVAGLCTTFFSGEPVQSVSGCDRYERFGSQS